MTRRQCIAYDDEVNRPKGKRMLIVEGPDGAGKTRLAQRLSEDLGWRIAPKAVGADTQALTDLPTYISLALGRGFNEQIYDRFALISGPIYGPIVHQKVGFQTEDSSLIRFWLRGFEDINPIVVLCLPPIDTMMQNLLEDDDGYNSKLASHMPAIWWMYWHWGTRAKVPPILWDYTQHEYNTLLARIQFELNTRGVGNW